MTRLRLAFALAILAGWATSVHSTPFSSPQDEVLGYLAAAFSTEDPARITHAYRDMGDYGAPAAGIVETTVNAMGYELLTSGEVEEAIKVFRLNTGTFPSSANSWDSLGEALMVKGDKEAAVRCYRVSLKLNPESNHAAGMIERMTGEQHLSYLTGEKS